MLSECEKDEEMEIEVTQQDQKKQKGKILILRLYDKLFSMLITHNQICQIQTQLLTDGQHTCRIGNLYVGRVQNVAANIGGAFVEIQKGTMAFLPLSEKKDAVLTNRSADGTLKTGDELIVQLVREPLKTKPAGVSAKLSLAGTYTVIEHRRTRTGKIRISSRLGAKYQHLYQNEASLLKIAEQFDLIIRTNVASAPDRSEVIAEAGRLASQMSHLLSIADKRVCFSCLHQNEPEFVRFVKNCYQSDYDEIVTDEPDICELLRADEQLTAVPIRFYQDERLPLYKLYSVETKIRELLDKKVWLKSGAYLVIEQTEALVSIDVNTGKYEAKKNPEETYLKINLEAADAIAAALRARNLSGMILVDFINMKQKAHTQQLTEYMKKLLKQDPVPAYVVDITGLGLMEITRQKKNKPFAEQFHAK